MIVIEEDKRPMQFRLRTLLLVVLAAAAALGVARWLGAGILPFLFAAVGVWVSARTRARHLLVWLVPSLWSFCAFGSYHHPGDEYGLFVGSALVAIWVAFVLDFGHLSEIYLLMIAVGAVPMALLGFVLDRLPVSRRIWAALYITASVVLFAWALSQYPTLEEAISKNGSISAYAFCAANMGLYLSVLLCLVGGTLLWSWRLIRRTRVDSAA